MSIMIILAAAVVAATSGLKPNPFMFLMAFLFFFEQNQYFGWNTEPQSDAEMIADGITYLLVALSFAPSIVTISINKG